MKRVFYFSSVSTDDLNRRFNYKFLVGASANKVLGVCGALRDAGVFPVIVSGVISARLFGRWSCVSNFRTSRVCYVRVFSLSSGILRRVILLFSLLWYSIARVRSRDIVIFYNFFPEYILSALYFRLNGRPAFLDIEDAPRSDQAGLWGILNPIFFAIMVRLCSRRYLTVSRQLGDQLRLGTFLPVYGVASHFDHLDIARDKFCGDTIKILYGGGGIQPETGLLLFFDAVRQLVETEPDLPLEFVITGNFPLQKFQDFANEIGKKSGYQMTMKPDLSAFEYRQMALEIDIGLCLKLPSHGVGQTTFPSKVIEYAAMGMLVCSTRVSDVPDIFDEETAIVLSTEEPEELASAISAAVKNRAVSARRAKAGRERILENFSKKRVGRAILDFLQEST